MLSVYHAYMYIGLVLIMARHQYLLFMYGSRNRKSDSAASPLKFFEDDGGKSGSRYFKSSSSVANIQLKCNRPKIQHQQR